MKRIFSLVTAILIVGLFVGCASTNINEKSNINDILKNSRNLNKYWSTPEKSWEKEIIKDLTEIMNQSVITKEDIAYMKDLPFGISQGRSPIDASKMPVSNSTRTNFTGKIINATTETIKIFINTDEPYIYRVMNILPGETGYFSCPIVRHKDIGYLNLDRFKDRYFFVEIDGKMTRFWSINEDTFHGANKGENDDAEYLTLCEEIVKTHSLELIYDGYHNDAKKYNYRFIEPFEYEWKD